MEYMHSPNWLWKSESFEIVHHILCIVFFLERETGFAKFLKKKKKRSPWPSELKNSDGWGEFVNLRFEVFGGSERPCFG